MDFYDACHRCQLIAPPPGSHRRETWVVLATPAGEELGLVCAECLVCEELALAHLEILRATHELRDAA